MRAAGATNCVRPSHFQHGGLNISDGCRSDHRPALVAQNIGFASAHAHHQATAAANIGDVLVRNDRQVVKYRGHGTDAAG